MTAQYPSAVATDARLKIAKNRVFTWLASSITSNDTIIPVRFAGDLAANMLITIGEEVLAITAVNGNNLTVERGVDDTDAAAHTGGSTVAAYITAWHHNVLAAEVKAIETALGPNLANITQSSTAAAFYAFAPQTPGGALTPGAQTVTLSPVPLGVNGSDQEHYLLINGVEAAKIIGGTAVAGASTGTVVLQVAGSHSAGYTISSASGGIKEAAVAKNDRGRIEVASGSHALYGPLVLGTRVSLRGQGQQATQFSCNIASGPALVAADNLGEASGGLGEWSDFGLTGPGAIAGTYGLWIGGDPAGVFAPNSWHGSFIRIRNVGVANFGTALHIQSGNFAVFENSFFGAGCNTALTTASAGDGQPVDFFGCTLSVSSSSPAVVLNNQYFDIHFFGGQVSGTITGTGVTWHSWGTHYEPNTANTPIVDVTAAGTHTVHIHGGLISNHVTGGVQPYAFRFTGGGVYYVTIDSPIIQCTIGQTITDFIRYGGSVYGALTIGGLDIQLAGTYTHIYTLVGSPVVQLRVDCNVFTGLSTIPVASTLAFPVGNYPERGVLAITGATLGGGGITAVSGLIQGQYGLLYGATTQTFTAGATIGNTKTCNPSIPVPYYFDGTKIWLG